MATLSRSYPDTPAGGETWTRNPDWLTMPTVTSGDHKFVGLYAVWPDEAALNVVALTANGNYTVDWGDGSTPENIASGVAGEHTYDYDDADLNGTAVGISDAVSCTFQDTGDTVTVTGHDFYNGQVIEFNSITTTTGISIETRYWVVNASTNTFQVAASYGGSAIALTNDGSGSVFAAKYRQAIITVTPNGGSLTAINLAQRPSTVNQTINWVTSYLEVILCGSNITAFQIQANVDNARLEHIKFIDHAITNYASMFTRCEDLQKITADFTLTTPTSFASMFNNCYKLMELDVTWPSAYTGAANTMFGSCYSLPSNQYPDMSGWVVSSAGSMFASNHSMSEVDFAPDFSALGSLNSTFSTALGLTSINQTLDLSSLTNMGFGFYNSNLSYIKGIKTSSSLADMSYAFSAAQIRDLPWFDTSGVTDWGTTFRNCVYLRYLPALDMSAATDTTNLFQGCRSIEDLDIIPPEISFTIDPNQMNATALDKLYTNLATVTSQTLTVTGVPGTSGDDPSIATAKGWTVVD